MATRDEPTRVGSDAGRCTLCGATRTATDGRCPICDGGASEVATFRPGDVIDGKYEVVVQLGVGGMGEVYKARHLALQTFRTIKVLKPSLLSDQDIRSRFLREAQMATRLQHPNLAVVFDFAKLDDGSSYIVSEFIEGTTLGHWIRSRGALPPPLAVGLGLQILAGLEYIHRSGLLHRDISAENVMVTPVAGRPVVKIIDLGIAKVVGGPSSGATDTGVFVGNLKYSSPEQIGAVEGTPPPDARSDLYSFGVLLYEMLVGVAPFSSPVPQGYILKHLVERPPSFHAQRPDAVISPPLEAMVFRALEKRREDRFASAAEMTSALGQLPEAKMETPPAAIPQLVELISIRHRAHAEAVATTPSARLRPAPGGERTRVLETPAPTSGRRQPDLAGGPRPRFRRGWILAAVGLAALGIVLAIRLRSAADAPAAELPSTIAPAPKSEAPVVPPSAAEAEGQLRIDATPWAEVKSIRDENGRDWMDSGPRYTPTLLSLPSGSYVVTLAPPDAKPERQVAAKVEAGTVREVALDVAVVDVAAILAKVGT